MMKQVAGTGMLVAGTGMLVADTGMLVADTGMLVAGSEMQMQMLLAGTVDAGSNTVGDRPSALFLSPFARLPLPLPS